MGGDQSSRRRTEAPDVLNTASYFRLRQVDPAEWRIGWQLFCTGASNCTGAESRGRIWRGREERNANEERHSGSEHLESPEFRSFELTREQAKKVTKSKAAKKSRKPAKRTFIKRAAEDDQKGNDESSTVETPASEESWRPCGGENNSSVVNSTDCLGIARISTWQAKAFVKALEERLEEYGGADDLIEDELEHGSEELTDVKARFGDEDVAMMVLKDLDGEKLAGRKLQVRLAEG